jgi:hypothetical protein
MSRLWPGNRLIRAGVIGMSAGGVPSSLLTNLQAYYAMEQAAGANAADATGNGHTLTQHGSPTQVAGIVGNAAGLASASSQYYSGSHLTAADGASKWTVAGWFYLAANNVNYVFGGIGNAGVSDWQYILQYRGADTQKFRVNLSTSVTDALTYGESSTVAPTTATWYHVGFVFDGTQTGNANRLKIYVNGSAQTLTFTGTIPSAMTTSTAALTVGATDDAFAFMNGRIDELAIANAAWTASQMASFYNAGSGITYPFLGVP